jgi:CspA family cold shock protein
MDTDQPRFADRMLQCRGCGTQFIFTVTEQREMAESSQPFSDPELCPNCRQKSLATTAASGKQESPPTTAASGKQESPPTTAASGRQRGRVKWFSRQRGYGFIIVESSGEEIFVHRTDLEGAYSLQEGQEVEFEIETTPKGPEAVRVSTLRAGARSETEY